MTGVDLTKYPYTQKSLLYAGLVGGTILVLSAFFMPAGQEESVLETLPSPTISLQISPQTPILPVDLETKRALSVSLTQSTVTPSPSPSPANSPTPEPVWHTVEENELLGYIAADYGTTVEKIMAANNLTDPTLLQIGQKLHIPVTVTPAPKITPSPTPSLPTYVIQPGDVLLAIANEFSTTVEAIMIVNNIIDPRTLQIGQELVIPPDKGSIFGVPAVIHEIYRGDTLLSIAAQYGSSVEDILANNPDLEPTRLQIGQKISVPLTQPHLNLGPASTQTRLTVPLPQLPGLLGLEQQMISGVNTQREIQGLPAYRVDEQLTISARAHAQDMVGQGYFSHNSLDGATLRDRLEEMGLLVDWTGENIQRNVQPFDQSAAYALNWFMSSRPHRTNILHPDYTRIGVGVAEGPTGWYTYVLVFAGD